MNEIFFRVTWKKVFMNVVKLPVLNKGNSVTLSEFLWNFGDARHNMKIDKLKICTT